MGKIFNPFASIPQKYSNEFTIKQIDLIKNRVRLFCFLALGINFLASVLTFLFYPKEFNTKEIPLWVIMLIGMAIMLFINKKIRTIRAAKLNAYIFTALLLLLLIKTCMIYYQQAEYSAPIFLFVLFLVAFTIPWTPVDLIPITILHIAAYTLLFLYFRRYLQGLTQFGTDIHTFFDGILFLLTGFVLCFVVRIKETDRDIENFLLLKEVEKKNEQFKQELEIATRVHNTLIPGSVSSDLVDIAVTYLPMQYIGGDYTKFHFIDSSKLIFIICDVTGHGVSAALLVNRLHTEFERLAKEGKTPGVLLKELNDFIVEDFEGTNMFLSAFCCLLDFEKKVLIYSNHGHPPQYIYKITDSSIKELEPQACLMGIFHTDNGVHRQELHFEKGDRILLFTDGVVETKNKEKELYGSKRLEQFILNNNNQPVELFNRALLAELDLFKEGPFDDDVLILSVRIK